MSLTTQDLIELGDPDELIRQIDRLCERRDWDGLMLLRQLAHGAVDRGHQLWGVAAHAEYRLALEAPADYAGGVVHSTRAPFALGPLPEVAASTHLWADLRDTVPEGPMREVLAYECVVRGEDLSGDASVLPYIETWELPLRLEPWEPAYPLAQYRATDAQFPMAVTQRSEAIAIGEENGTPLEDPDGSSALLGLVNAWTTQSNGTAKIAAVEGTASAAIAAVAPDTTQIVRISHEDAIAHMAWAAASGGAHGRRAGMAAGRSKAWWTAAAVAGLRPEWPLEPSELGATIRELQWWTWGTSQGEGEWSLRLAIADPLDAVAFAIDATDRAEI